MKLSKRKTESLVKGIASTKRMPIEEIIEVDQKNNNSETQLDVVKDTFVELVKRNGMTVARSNNTVMLFKALQDDPSTALFHTVNADKPQVYAINMYALFANLAQLGFTAAITYFDSTTVSKFIDKYLAQIGNVYDSDQPNLGQYEFEVDLTIFKEGAA